MCFWTEAGQGRRKTRLEAGPWAVEQYLERFGGVRFLQSFKTFAASKAFVQTRIFGAPYNYEDIMAAFLGSVLEHAAIPARGSRVVVGRPVRFAGAAADDELAIAALSQRAGCAGDRAARIERAGRRRPLRQPHLAARADRAIADFGGGTSDFSILRMEGTSEDRRIQPLRQGGVGVAGDSFDHRIIERIVAAPR